MPRFRVWNIINPPARPAHFPVESPEAGAALIARLAAEQLQDEHVTCNVFGLEVQVAGGKWEEWEDEQGRNVGEVFG